MSFASFSSTCFFFFFGALWLLLFFFFSSRRRHTICSRDWSSDLCSSDLSIRRKSQKHIANSDLASIDDLAAIDHADDAPRQIVFPAPIHSRHLRGLTADERALGRATGLGKDRKSVV